MVAYSHTRTVCHFHGMPCMVLIRRTSACDSDIAYKPAKLEAYASKMFLRRVSVSSHVACRNQVDCTSGFRRNGHNRPKE